MGLASLLLLPVASSAAIIPIAISNPDFETITDHTSHAPVSDTALAFSDHLGSSATLTSGLNPPSYNNAGTVTVVDIPGWVNSGGLGGIEKLGTPFTPSNTTNLGYVGTFSTNAASIAQTLSDTLLSGAVYTLTVEVNRRTDQTSVGAGANDFPVSFAGSLLAGSTALVATAPAIFITPLAGSASTYSISFDSLNASNLPLVGQPLTITFSTSTGQVNLDNVSLTAVTVPESSSIALACAGLFGLVLAARRRTQRS